MIIQSTQIKAQPSLMALTKLAVSGKSYAKSVERGNGKFDHVERLSSIHERQQQ